VPVLLAATGGSDRHALAIDHQLRPLFSFFQAHTLPIGVYATDRDFENNRVSSDALRARIALAVERAVPVLRQRSQRPVAAAAVELASAHALNKIPSFHAPVQRRTSVGRRHRLLRIERLTRRGGHAAGS